MRHSIITIVLLISLTLTVRFQTGRQYNDLTKQFTDSIFAGMHQNNKQVILAELIDSSTFHYLKRILSVDTFLKRVTYDGGKTIKIDTFILNASERRLMDSFYQLPENFLWTKELINATILTSDTVRSIYKRREDIGNYLGRHYGDRRLFTLSKPIFLRNNSICIFFKGSDCGFLCGGGTLAIYRKEEAKWSRYMILADWVE